MTGSPVDRSASLASGLRLAYRDWGGSGRSVVLVHGLASSYTIWDFVAPLLARSLRVVAIDQRAHGRSDRPEGALDFGTYVGDLAELLALLDLRPAILVGHSWGGNVALQFAVDRPADTAGLVLVDGGFLELSNRPGWTWERAREELAPPPLEGISREDLLQRVSTGDLRLLWSEEMATSVLGHFEQLSDGRLRPWLRREHHLEILRALWEHHPSQLWEHVRCPVLLVPARRSQAEGRQAEFQSAKQMAVEVAESRLARHRTVWMDETIHDVPLQRPAELAELISSFVAELEE